MDRAALRGPGPARPGPGRMPPQKPVSHHLPGAVNRGPTPYNNYDATTLGTSTHFLKSFESCATLADALEPLALPQVDYVVDQAVKPPSTLADTGACLQLMSEGDFLGAHDVCEGLVEKGAGQGDAARSTAFSIISALCGELTGTYDLAHSLDRLDDNIRNDPARARSSTSDERSRRRPRRPWATRWRRRRAPGARCLSVRGRAQGRRADRDRGCGRGGGLRRGGSRRGAPPKALTALDELVAIKPAKALFAALTDAAQLAEERQDDLRETSFSCVFSGNPGTGKIHGDEALRLPARGTEGSPSREDGRNDRRRTSEGRHGRLRSARKKVLRGPPNVNTTSRRQSRGEAGRVVGQFRGKSCLSIKTPMMSDMATASRSRRPDTELGTSARKEGCCSWMRPTSWTLEQ